MKPISASRFRTLNRTLACQHSTAQPSPPSLRSPPLRHSALSHNPNHSSHPACSSQQLGTWGNPRPLSHGALCSCPGRRHNRRCWRQPAAATDVGGVASRQGESTGMEIIVDSLTQMATAASLRAFLPDMGIGGSVFNHGGEQKQPSLSAEPEQPSLSLPAAAGDAELEKKVSQIFDQWKSLSSPLQMKALRAMGRLHCTLTAGQKEQLASSYPEDLLQSLSPRDLTSLIRSFTELDITPGSSWVSQLLQSCEASLIDCLASDLCDLTWAASRLHKQKGLDIPIAFLDVLAQELGYQLHEFPADFESNNIVDLITGLAELQVDVQKHRGWVPAFMKTARLKVKEVGTGAVVNQSLGRLQINEVITPRDARCSYEEIHWLPRHERDVREMAKRWKPSQWTGYSNEKKP